MGDFFKKLRAWLLTEPKVLQHKEPEFPLYRQKDFKSGLVYKPCKDFLLAVRAFEAHLCGEFDSPDIMDSILGETDSTVFFARAIALERLWRDVKFPNPPTDEEIEAAG